MPRLAFPLIMAATFCVAVPHFALAQPGVGPARPQEAERAGETTAADTASAAATAAERAEPAGGFTFKRVKPQGQKAGGLISIQVTPVVPVERVLSHVPNVPKVAPVFPHRVPAVTADGAASWFWGEISPAMSDAGSARLAQAQLVLERHSDRARILVPSRDRLAGMSEKYGAHIAMATRGTRVSPALVLAVMSVESGGRPTAESSAGAVGLMQLMPATARRFGVIDRTDPAQSILGGVQYLDFLLDEFAGDAVLAIAAYNAGEGAVQRNGGVPNYKETRNYVPRVVSAWTQARLLCTTPPLRVGDACDFSGVKLARR